MLKIKNLSIGIAFAYLININVSFSQNVVLEIHDSINKVLSIDKFSDGLKDILNKNSTGWGLQIWKDNKVIKSEKGGIRLAKIDNQKDNKDIAFSLKQRMHVASISKTITAIATAKILDEKGLDWNSKIKDHLPKNWKLHESLLETTFGHLLEMRSGIKSQNNALTSGYFNLKSIIEEGIDTSSIGKYQYQNVSYGLLRVLIAELNGYSYDQHNIDSLLVKTSSSNSYIHYINMALFKPLDIQQVVCRETSNYPTMMYPFPYNGEKGLISGYAGYEKSNGDLSNYVGGLGWYISVHELGLLLNEFFNSEKLLSKKVFKNLLNQRFPFYKSKNITSEYISGMGMWIWSKPNENYTVGLNTIYILYPNNILVVAFVNSKGKGIKNLNRLVNKAYNENLLN